MSSIVKKFIATGTVSLVLTGCAPMTPRKPIIYGSVPGANRQYDEFACQQFAEESTKEDPTIGHGAVAGAIGGILLGAALGALTGGMVGNAGSGAAWGAGYGTVLGGTQGAAVNAVELERRKKEAVLLCLKSRGYEATF
jgi:hypothetical protein